MKRRYCILVLLIGIILFAGCGKKTSFTLNHKEVPEDLAELYAKAEAGDATAQDSLAVTFWFGLFRETDNREAFYWALPASKQGKERSRAILAMALLRGKRTIHNESIGENILQHYAKQGDGFAQATLGYYYSQDRRFENNEKEGISWLKKSAQKSNPWGQYYLAPIYLFGIGVEENREEAIRLYQLSADQGFARAYGELSFYTNDPDKDFLYAKKGSELGDYFSTFALALCYKHGRGTEKDEKEALRLYKKAAEWGYTSFMIDVAECYEKGIGTEKDEKEALKWYKKAADLGSVSAMYDLAQCYEKGVCTSKDENEAFYWYKMAVDNGYDQDYVLNPLAWRYHTGTGTVANSKEAFRLYNMSKPKEKWVLRNMGHLYRLGNGVPENYRMAAKFYKKAAYGEDGKLESGDKYAQFGLAMLLDEGLAVNQDYAEALKLFRSAAEKNDRDAANWIGTYYTEGKSVAKNQAEALRWYRLAAEKGEPYAMANIAYTYADFSYVNHDYKLAYQWMCLASGYAEGEKREECVKNRDLYREKLTPRQISEAEAVALDFERKYLQKKTE